jgi:hypothetical protein
MTFDKVRFVLPQQGVRMSSYFLGVSIGKVHLGVSIGKVCGNFEMLLGVQQLRIAV